MNAISPDIPLRRGVGIRLLDIGGAQSHITGTT